MKSLDQLKTKLQKNPQTRAEYDALAGEFETARELIAVRTQAGRRHSDGRSAWHHEERDCTRRAANSPEQVNGAALCPGGGRACCGADWTFGELEQND